MPFAGFKDWDACVAEIRRKNPSYSADIVDKVCGKLKSKLEKCNNTEAAHKAVLESLKQFSNSEPSPGKKDLKEVEPYPIHKAWEFNPDDILASPRKVTGTFHVPKMDKDREIITESAMRKAIPNYMHLPILHDYHKERVLGIVTKVWEEADAFHFDALFKATADVDDAWEKAKRGVYDHVSIYGARLNGSASCGLNPSQRAEPCISNEIRLDSISACDEGARNDHTSMEVVKASEVTYNNENIERFLIDGEDIFIKASNMDEDLEKSHLHARQRRGQIDYHRGSPEDKVGSEFRERRRELYHEPRNVEKAEDTGSGLMHGTYDGAKSEGKCGCEVKKIRVREVDEKEEDDEEMEKGYNHDNLSRMGKQQRERREHAEKVFGSKQEPGKWEKYEKAEEDYMEKAEGLYKSLIKAINSVFGKGDEMEKAEEYHSHSGNDKVPQAVKDSAGSEYNWQREQAKKPVKKGEDKSEIGYNKKDEEIEDKKFESKEGEKQEESTGKKDVPPKKRFKREVEKGTRPTVKEEPVDPKKIGTSQPVDKRVSEVEKSVTKPHLKSTSTVSGRGATKYHNPMTGTVSSSGSSSHSPKDDMKPGWSSSFKKADTMTEENTEVKEEIVKAEVSDEQFVEEIVKANLPNTEEIVKAQMKTMVDEITKAFEAKFETLEKELKEIKEQPLVKAAVLIPEDGKVNGVALNYEAITKFMEKR